jgi:3',5'-cyclic-AMP phosphodiesterase
MPLTLPATRRRFLTGAAATAVATLSRAQEATTSELWYLMSDTHIAADPATFAREVNVAAHLEQAVKGVLAGQQQEKAFGLFINGDLALDNGQPGDYATFVKLLQPVRDSGLDVHLTLGNHDDREKFKEGCSESLQLMQIS